MWGGRVTVMMPRSLDSASSSSAYINRLVHVANLFGEMDLIAQGVLYAGMFLALALAGRQAALGWPYWAGLGVAVVLVAWEFGLARTRARADCFRAFLHNHWVGMAVFAGIALDFALRAKTLAA